MTITNAQSKLRQPQDTYILHWPWCVIVLNHGELDQPTRTCHNGSERVKNFDVVARYIIKCAILAGENMQVPDRVSAWERVAAAQQSVNSLLRYLRRNAYLDSVKFGLQIHSCAM